MDAIVMCGGEGTRLADSLGRTDVPEKPLYPIDGEPMVGRVLDALAESDVERIHVAVSPATPETREYVTNRVEYVTGRASLLRTPGEGYVADLTAALDAVGRPALTVAADLPLLTGPVVDEVLDAYAADGTDDSMTVAVPAPLKDRLGVSADSVVEIEAFTDSIVDARSAHTERPARIAPSGLNVVGKTTTDTMYLTDDKRLAVNVNRARDAQVAEVLA